MTLLLTKEASALLFPKTTQYSRAAIGRLLPVATLSAGQVRGKRLVKSSANEWASAMQTGG
jgi:hypothetical protein